MESVLSLTATDAARLLGHPVKGTKIKCPATNHAKDVWASTFPDGGWKCHDCGLHGDVADVVLYVQGCTQREAFRWVEEHGGAAPKVEIPEGIPPVQYVRESERLWMELRGGNEPEYIAQWCFQRGLPAQPAYDAGVRGGQANYAADHPAAHRADGKVQWPYFWDVQGTFWPLYHPSRLDAPSAWRFRPLEPLKGKYGPVKCVGVSGTLARSTALYRQGSQGLIICEGEPDWLVWCIRRPHASVVGLVSGRWWPEFSAFARGAMQWAWVGHQSDHEERLRLAIEESAGRYGASLHVNTVPESDDWADRWLARQRAAM